MIEFGDLKRGQCLQYKGVPVVITDVKFSNPTARGASMIGKTKMRNLLTGQVLSDSFRSGDKFEEVEVEPLLYTSTRYPDRSTGDSPVLVTSIALLNEVPSTYSVMSSVCASWAEATGDAVTGASAAARTAVVDSATATTADASQKKKA